MSAFRNCVEGQAVGRVAACLVYRAQAVKSPAALSSCSGQVAFHSQCPFFRFLSFACVLYGVVVAVAVQATLYQCNSEEL